MTVDLSRSVLAMLEGAKQRAEIAQQNNQLETAKSAYHQAANYALQYAEYASSAVEKKRRLEVAAKFQELSSNLINQGSQSANQIQVEKTAEHEEEFSDQIKQLIHKSKIQWKDIAGLKETIQSIKTAYALSLVKAPSGVSLSPVRNMLFYGPPGCGKSLLAAATSHGLAATFFNVKVSSLLSKYFGESPKMISKLYETARTMSPAVIFIDEIDALAGSRDNESGSAERRLLTNLLSELDGVAEKGSNSFVLTIAATNTPWALDAAILSRFERQIYIPLPDSEARKRMFQIHLHQRGYQTELSLEQLAELSEGYSGREIESICKIVVNRMITNENPELDQLAERGTQALSDFELKTRPLRASELSVVFEENKPQTSQEVLARNLSWNHQ